MRIVNTYLTVIIGGISLLAACAEEQPPRSTAEFLENPIILEAAMVRCAQDRAATRYDAECINARQAVQQIEAKEEAARRAEFDARSKSKRQALRRTQQAAAQARQRAAEAQRLREEAEYLAQFGVAPPHEDQESQAEIDTGNLPIAVIPEIEPLGETIPESSEVAPAIDGGNAAGISIEAQDEAPVTDLESIRDELQRRNAESSD